MILIMISSYFSDWLAKNQVLGSKEIFHSKFSHDMDLVGTFKSSYTCPKKKHCAVVKSWKHHQKTTRSLWHCWLERMNTTTPFQPGLGKEPSKMRWRLRDHLWIESGFKKSLEFDTRQIDAGYVSGFPPLRYTLGSSKFLTLQNRWLEY